MARNTISCKRKRASANELMDSDNGVRSTVLQYAEELQANLSPEFPSFIKCMLPSHVTGGFWLGLPKKFCDEHMPKQDTIIILEDERWEVTETKYLAEKVGLSGGWRGFSMAHKLVEKDVLVFHLVERNKFKVHIVRANGSDEVWGALGLLNLDSRKLQAVPVHEENKLCFSGEELEDQYNEPPLIEIYQEVKKNRTSCRTSNPLAVPSDQSQNEIEDLGFEISDGIRMCESIVDFKEVKSLEDFDILVDGLVINSELSKHLQTKYYELCCSQNSFIHEGLLRGLNCKLIAGVIAETINISDAIRASKISTSLKNFATWEMTLKSFQTLGMNITFLLTRLEQLTRLATKSKRYKELKLEREDAKKEMKLLEVKLSEVKEKVNQLHDEIETVDKNSDNWEALFQKIAEAPW